MPLPSYARDTNRVMSPMRLLGTVLGLDWYWADRRFTRPGVYVFAWGRNRRVLPVPHQLAGLWSRL